MDLFQQVLASDPRDCAALRQKEPFLFIGLLTIKLWLDQRSS
jgi:hypothetical protein